MEVSRFVRWLMIPIVLSLMACTTATPATTTLNGLPERISPTPSVISVVYESRPTLLAPSTRPDASKVQPESKPRMVSTPSPTTVISGTASWGPFKGNIVTRHPRGTIVQVCGKLGCSEKLPSWGYGPQEWTGHIVDLDVAIFEQVCGPRSIGICKVTLTVFAD